MRLATRGIRRVTAIPSCSQCLSRSHHTEDTMIDTETNKEEDGYGNLSVCNEYPMKLRREQCKAGRKITREKV